MVTSATLPLGGGWRSVAPAATPGVGKTRLAIALAREASRQGYSAIFVAAPSLVAALAKGHAEGCLAFFAKLKLLIIDEPARSCSMPPALFFQLISRRYERGSMLITSSRSVGARGEASGDAVVATVILHRPLLHSLVVTIRGDNYRQRDERRAGLLKAAAVNPEQVA